MALRIEAHAGNRVGGPAALRRRGAPLTPLYPSDSLWVNQAGLVYSGTGLPRP